MPRRLSAPAFAALALAAAPAAAAVPAPLVDHHQHLLSEPGRDVSVTWPSPAVAVPADIQALLSARETAWNDKAKLAALYADDAMVFTGDSPGWVSGREAAAGYFAIRFGRPFRIRPTVYVARGDAARVAGYYTRGEGLAATYPGYVQLELVRQGGVWKIAAETAVFPGPRIEPTVDAARLVGMLDAAGIRRAVIFSDAYYFARGATPKDGELARVQAENDWTAAQIAPYAGRLVAACGLNPLRDYAVAEMHRCVDRLGFKALKIHFDAGAVDLNNPDHVARVQRLIAAANTRRIPVIAHVQQGNRYGEAEARVILEQLLPAAPDVPVQICHLWGGGGWSPGAAAALELFAKAVEAGDPRMKNVWFDVAQIAMVGGGEADLKVMAAAMRRIGLERMLYGSDGPEWNGVPPAQHWAELQARLPLSEAEFTTLATNVAPYLR